MFRIGEKVGLLYETGHGVVKDLRSNNCFLVEDDQGFERVFRLNELVRIHSTDFHLPDDAVAQINDDDSVTEKHYTSHREQRTGSKKALEIWELDLHIETLTESHSGMSNAEILTLQLRELRSFYNAARDKRIRKLVIIHGVGEGVLKTEVRIFLSSKEGLEYYDADFRDYGKGATAVDLFYQ